MIAMCQKVSRICDQSTNVFFMYHESRTQKMEPLNNTHVGKIIELSETEIIKFGNS